MTEGRILRCFPVKLNPQPQVAPAPGDRGEGHTPHPPALDFTFAL